MALQEVQLCFPQLLNASCRKPDPPGPETVFLYSLLYFMSVITSTLNLLVIISISHFRQLHTPTNFLLLSLAVSDFFVGFLLVPAEIMVSESCWMLGDVLCAVYYLLLYIITITSVVSMVLISVDRYVAICHPLHYSSSVTKDRTRVCVCLCWLYSVLLSVFIFSDHLLQPGRYNSCSGECLVDFAGDIDLTLGFIIPISVIIVLHMRVFMVAVSQARAMRSRVVVVMLQISGTVKARKSEMKAGKNLSVVVLVFLMCYCPYYCVSLSGNKIVIGSSTEVFMVFLMYSNSCLNPVIYVFLYPWLRKSLRLIVELHVLQPGSRDANVL